MNKEKKILNELEKYNKKHNITKAVPRETGKFLKMLVLLKKPEKALEIGTFKGYSGIWICSGLKENMERHAIKGKLNTVEIIEDNSREAKDNFIKAGLDEFAEVINGNALKVLEKMNDDKAGFDFVFIDAKKEDYIKYLKIIEDKLAENALIIADNAISHKERMEDYLEYVNSNENYKSFLIPICKGEQISIFSRKQ